MDNRLKEAQKLGFSEAITAPRNKKKPEDGINIRETVSLREFVSMVHKYKDSTEGLGDGKP